MFTFDSTNLKSISLWVALDENICVRLGSDVVQEGAVSPNQAAHNHLGQYKLKDGGHLVTGHRAASSRGAGRGRDHITASFATVTGTLHHHMNVNKH